MFQYNTGHRCAAKAMAMMPDQLVIWPGSLIERPKPEIDEADRTVPCRKDQKPRNTGASVVEGAKNHPAAASRESNNNHPVRRGEEEIAKPSSNVRPRHDARDARQTGSRQ